MVGVQRQAFSAAKPHVEALGTQAATGLAHSWPVNLCGLKAARDLLTGASLLLLRSHGLQRPKSLLPMGEATAVLLAALLQEELAQQRLLGPRPGRVARVMSKGAVLRTPQA